MTKILSIGVLPLIGVIALALLLANPAAAASDNDGPRETRSDGEITFNIEEVARYIVDMYGCPLEYKPSAGMKFVRVTGTLMNINSDYPYFTNHPFEFKLLSNDAGFVYNEHNTQIATLAKGGLATFDICYEIPVIASDYALEWRPTAYTDINIRFTEMKEFANQLTILDGDGDQVSSHPSRVCGSKYGEYTYKTGEILIAPVTEPLPF